MTESSGRFRDFAARLLEHQGALVERIEPAGLDVVAPPHAQQALHISESERLGFAAELPPGALRAGLESDWLERFGQLLGEKGRQARFILDVPSPTLANPERVVEHGLVLQNAIYRVVSAAPAWTRYLITLFRYTAISDEKREGLIKVGLNLANGAAIDGFVDELLATVIGEANGEEIALPSGQLPPDWSAARLDACLSRALPPRIRLHLSPFLNGMQRRLERDLARVFDYYNDLRHESLSKLQKHSAEPAREQLRLEALAREYTAKVADLQQKYALRVEVEQSQTMELVMPVQRINLLIKRRKGERQIALDWNPLARKLDAPPCEWSFTTGVTRLVCDEALHLVAPAAHAACAHCGKPFCRACHPQKCPKCRLAN
ncbi:MAG: hypothetical protein WKF30_14830 [Pyrinomonadaceae bacterium]